MKKKLTHIVFATFLCIAVASSLQAQVPILVKNVNASGSSYPQYITAVGNKVYFNANGNSTSGEELWVSDGTISGTYQLAEIFPGSVGSDPKNLIEVNGKLFFSAKDASHGEELWVYDPVTNDTSFLKDIYQGTTGSSISNMFNFNGTLLFTARSINEGNELWKSDGTPSGTVLVSNINPGVQHAFQPGFPAYFAIANNYLYFVATSNLSGTNIYKTDGTNAGTSIYINIQANSGSNPRDLFAIDSILYFRAYTAQYEYELYKSNVNITGFSIVKDINTGNGGSYPVLSNPNCYIMANLNDTLFFVANDGASGYGDELWMTTGFDSTTVRISDIHGGPWGSDIMNLFSYNGNVYFSATNGPNSNGHELYFTNGMQNLSPNAAPFADLIGGSNSSYPGQFVEFNGKLYLVASSFNVLYETDGFSCPSVNGQQHVSNLCATTSALFFQSHDNTNGYELWKLDPSTTSISESNTTVSKYPNPTTGIITFTSTTAINQIEIYSLTGQLLDLQTANQSLNKQIDLSGYEAGVYIAVITTSEGKSSQRIIKQ